jgi:allantoate deiminase
MGGPITAMLDDIASCSGKGPGVTRLPFTQEHHTAAAKIRKWMQDTGLTVHMDAAGTIIGRREGAEGGPTLLFGSHQDTVRHGGKYDGIMGVLLPILALRAIDDLQLPFSVQVMAFADEEGVRFPTALIGPRALAGNLDPAVLDLKDQDGISIRDTMVDFGLRPDEIKSLDLRNTPVIGYIETHIEQGPVLDDENLPLGIVTAIAGIERHQITLKGCAGHAGTTPMRGRLDSLACAAELVLTAERISLETPELIATIGKMNVSPNAVNVIPGEVSMILEVRSAVDETREHGGETIVGRMKEIATRRSIGFACRKTYIQPAVPCDGKLQSLLKEAVSSLQLHPIELPSGATHDASAMADLCPMAMLFVRCRQGISHTPEEFAEEADMQVAVDSLVNFIKLLK